jgi:hypothetical protein
VRTANRMHNRRGKVLSAVFATSFLLMGAWRLGYVMPCAVSGETANHIVIMQTVLAGVPAILRVPEVVIKPPILLWHGLGPPAGNGELMEALPLDDVPAVKVYLGLPLFGARAPAGRAESLAQR